MKKALKITDDLFEKLKLALDHLNKDTEKQLVICLSIITYHYSILSRKREKGKIDKKNLDICMDDKLFESLFSPDY